MNFALSAKYNKTSSSFQLCCSAPLSQSFPYTFKKVFLSGASQLEAHKCYIKRSCRRSLRAQKALFRARHMFYKYQVSLPGFFFYFPVWNCNLRLSIQSEIQLYFQKLHWLSFHWKVLSGCRHKIRRVENFSSCMVFESFFTAGRYYWQLRKRILKTVQLENFLALLILTRL